MCMYMDICSACGLVLELEVCRVRFARVSCPRLRFVDICACTVLFLPYTVRPVVVRTSPCTVRMWIHEVSGARRAPPRARSRDSHTHSHNITKRTLPGPCCDYSFFRAYVLPTLHPPTRAGREGECLPGRPKSRQNLKAKPRRSSHRNQNRSTTRSLIQQQSMRRPDMQQEAHVMGRWG